MGCSAAAAAGSPAAFLLTAIAAIVITDTYTWLVMLVLVTLLGADHPPTANDRVRIGPLRWMIGAASLAIPVLCFTPTPLRIDDYGQRFDDSTFRHIAYRRPGDSSKDSRRQSLPSYRAGHCQLELRPPMVVAAADPAEAMIGAMAEIGGGALCGGRGCCSAGWT